MGLGLLRAETLAQPVTVGWHVRATIRSPVRAVHGAAWTSSWPRSAGRRRRGSCAGLRSCSATTRSACWRQNAARCTSSARCTARPHPRGRARLRGRELQAAVEVLPQLVGDRIAALRRYRADGATDELIAAVEAFDTAVTLAVPGLSDWALALANLGLALRDRVEAWGEQADLRRAVDVLEESVELTAAAGEPDVSARRAALVNLGSVLLTSLAAGGPDAELRRGCPRPPTPGPSNPPPVRTALPRSCDSSTRKTCSPAASRWREQHFSDDARTQGTREHPRGS